LNFWWKPSVGVAAEKSRLREANEAGSGFSTPETSRSSTPNSPLR